MTIESSEWDKMSLTHAFYQVTKSIRDDFSADSVNRQIDELAELAKQHFSRSPRIHVDAKLEQLLHLFYQTWDFQCASGVYCLSEAIWLDRVLESRRGTPVSLGLILLSLAERLDIPLEPVVFPTQFLLKVAFDKQTECWINPFNGERVSEQQLALWIEGYYGLGHQHEADHFSKSQNSQVMYNVLTVLKNAFMYEHKPELALAATQLMLAIKSDDPYVIRDRGLIYVQLECDYLALHDLNEFVECCPDDPIVDVVKMQMQSLEENRVILH